MAGVLHLIVLGICLGVSNANISSRVVGGNVAAIGRYPWTVSLRGANSASHFCGGSLITRQHVLTAAHCTINSAPTSIFVVTGSISNAEGGQNHAVSHVRNHENYIGQSDRWRFDISVLRLVEPVELSATRTIIPLASAETLENESCFSSGWGRIHFPAVSLPAAQQVFDTTSMSTLQCGFRWGLNNIDNNHLCTLSPVGVGVCSGDSGGPLICNNELAGVVSWGNPCANGMPDVFARVSVYLDWIANNTADIDHLNF